MNGIITVAEYIAWKQPDVAAVLLIRLATMRLKELEKHSLRWWARLMQERPKPGLGGLLEGEKAV